MIVSASIVRVASACSCAFDCFTRRAGIGDSEGNDSPPWSSGEEECVDATGGDNDNGDDDDDEAADWLTITNGSALVAEDGSI